MIVIPDKNPVTLENRSYSKKRDKKVGFEDKSILERAGVTLYLREEMIKWRVL